MAYPSKTDRKTILAAAVQQLDREGLRGLSLRGLAATLELAPTALYRYFADRAALEAALAGEVSHLLLAAMQKAVRKGTTEQAIRGIASAYLAFARKHPNLYELLLLPCPPDGEHAPAHEDLWAFYAGHITALTGPGHVDDAAVSLWAFLHGIAQLEAAQVFGSEKPATSVEFGLNAWLAAASSASPPSKPRKG